MSFFENIRRFGWTDELAAGEVILGDSGVSSCAAVQELPDIDIIKKYDKSEYTVFPGFCDVHVHLREPGFSYKGTVADGCAAAAAGGITAVCAMPNLNPVPDSREHIALEQAVIDRDACIDVYPYASITVNEAGRVLSDMEELAPLCIAFSDDGKGIQDEEMMRRAMIKAASLGKMIVAHCEVNELLHGGYIHDGEYAAARGHRGICSESEWRQIERDVRLAEETGCAYHVCHISTKESVEIIRQAKAKGVNVTCETAPHYLLMNDTEIGEDGRFKMNPPIRSEADRLALVEGIMDKTIDMIITDHAPHSDEEKAGGLEKSPMGVVGLETSFAALYTGLVKKGIISLERLMELMVYAPRRRFGIPFKVGDFSVWDLNEEYVIDPSEFHTAAHATPFAGRTVTGRCLLTVHDGRIVYRRRELYETGQTNG